MDGGLVVMDGGLVVMDGGLVVIDGGLVVMDGGLVVVYLNLVPANQQNIAQDLETAVLLTVVGLTLLNSPILLKPLFCLSNQISVLHTLPSN